MPTIEVLRLVRGSEHVHSFPLGDAALEVGSDPSCDVTLQAPAVPSRAWLVVPAGGTVHVYDLQRSAALRHRSVLPIGEATPIGADYHLIRTRVPRPSRASGATDVLRAPPREVRPIALVQGRGTDSKTISLIDGPFSMGSSKACSVFVPDRAVSALHCRFEPFGYGVALRDLGSTNGTWVDGARVQRSVVRPGSTIRVGRTEFQVAGGPIPGAGTCGPVAVSGGMLRVLADVDRFSQVRWPALIRGETGVGKELVAKALHDRGVRRAGPFVALNGGGLPPQLIESELFGHERGAFTGASQAHRGAFEQATGGTLFLDEVAELPAPVQTRLLRVLESWQVRRVGSEVARKVDVRLVCATHRDLRAMVQRGEFRADLYYR
ncbi:MAG: sigma-54-dependent Fis family transcriptional regulator, partial [Polyangiales bacterium]